MKVNNPVLKGFNPDPTMCFANGKYYIATSTFQWYPGITIYESEDLANWKIIACPLTEELAFNLEGIDDSAGVWAPNLIFENNSFYLSYTIVKSATGVYYDMENYITISEQVDGKWTQPVQVNSGCFDPSLFFDEGRLYLLGKIVDHRYEPSNNYIENYSGIIAQELNPDSFELIGNYRIISHGTGLGGEEGPQIFKRNGYYYLNIAEGGTEYGHQTTVMRSENLFGPFELHPDNPILKSKPESYLQKAGHSSFVHIGHDNWLLSHLCARPIQSLASEIKGKLCCPLGRETAIQNLYWKNDWPYVEKGPGPSSCFQIEKNLKMLTDKNIDYSCEELPDNRFLNLRKDMSDYNSAVGGKLMMVGKDSLMSRFDVNLYGYRVDSFNFETSVTLDYCPKNYLQMSGIGLYYDTENYITIFVTHDEKFGKCVKVEAINHNKYSTLGFKPITISDGQVILKFKVEGDIIRGSFVSQEKENVLDFKYHSSYLSDDYILMKKPSFFTGMMSCFYSSDLSGKNIESAILNFKYTQQSDIISQ